MFDHPVYFSKKLVAGDHQITVRRREGIGLTIEISERLARELGLPFICKGAPKSSKVTFEGSDLIFTGIGKNK